jgi:hypothetical protein
MTVCDGLRFEVDIFAGGSMVMIFALKCRIDLASSQFTLIMEHLIDSGLVRTQVTSS